jgi:hypothetical protein
MTKGTLKIDFNGSGIKTYEVVIKNTTITPRLEEYKIHLYHLDKFDNLKSNTPEGDYMNTINKGVDIEFDGYVLREIEEK